MSNQEEGQRFEVSEAERVSRERQLRWLDDPGFVAREHVLAFVQSKWRGDGKCPICKEVAWVMHNIGVLPVRPPRMATGQASLEDVDAVFPFAPLVCENCGYTMFFSENVAREAESGEGET